ncbi:hypothetical protein AAMO2058_000364200 [Amorphochlora amoebiformis]
MLGTSMAVAITIAAFLAPVLSAEKFDGRMLFPGGERIERGELASKQIRQVTFDFIDDVSANMTSSCTVLCLLRASPMEDWIPGKKKRVKIYLSLDGPPYHGQYQRRGTVKLADKASTGIARMQLSASQLRVYIALAGPNVTKNEARSVNFTLKVRAACAPAFETAVTLASGEPSTFQLTPDAPSVLFRLPNARAPEITTKVLKGAANDKKHAIMGTYAMDSMPQIWDRKAKALASRVPWTPFPLACSPGDTMVLLYLQSGTEWHRNTEEYETRIEISVEWDIPRRQLTASKPNRIVEVCGSKNETLMYVPKNPEAPWIVWVKVTPSRATTDLGSLDQETELQYAVPAVYLNPDSCATQSSHAIAILEESLESPRGGTVSPPNHLPASTHWMVTIQASLGYCQFYSVTLFEKPKAALTDGFEIGQKLEAVDFFGNHCVATIAGIDQLFHRIFVHFDGWDGDWDFWTTPLANTVAPVGTSESMAIPLDPPKGYLSGAKENFDWDVYLEETASEAVPKESFKQSVFFDMDWSK